MSEEELSRRKFLAAGIGIISGAIVVGMGAPALISIGAPAVTNKKEGKWVEACSLEELTEGQFTKVGITYQAKDGWLEGNTKQLVYLKKEGENIFALSATCSHLGCNVGYDEESGHFKCPCHSGVYDSTGKNISGPPPKPLQQMETKAEDGKLMIFTGIKEA